MGIKLLKATLPPLLGKQVLLRLLRQEDEEQYYGAVCQSGEWEETPTQAEIGNAIAIAVLGRDRYDFLVSVNGEYGILGEVSLYAIDWNAGSCRLKLRLFSMDWEDQPAVEALQLALYFLFERICLHRVETEIPLCSPVQQHLFEAAGFQLEGCRREALCRDGKFGDILLFSMLEKEYISKQC